MVERTQTVSTTLRREGDFLGETSLLRPPIVMVYVPNSYPGWLESDPNLKAQVEILEELRRTSSKKSKPNFLFIARFDTTPLSRRSFLNLSTQPMDVRNLISIQKPVSLPSKQAVIAKDAVHAQELLGDPKPNFAFPRVPMDKDPYANTLFAAALVNKKVTGPSGEIIVAIDEITAIAKAEGLEFDRDLLKFGFTELIRDGLYEELAKANPKCILTKTLFHREISGFLKQLSWLKKNERDMSFDTPLNLCGPTDELSLDLEFLPHCAQITYDFCVEHLEPLMENGMVLYIFSELRRFISRQYIDYLRRETLSEKKRNSMDRPIDLMSDSDRDNFIRTSFVLLPDSAKANFTRVNNAVREVTPKFAKFGLFKSPNGRH